MYQVIIIEDDPMVAAINRQYLEEHTQMQIAGEFRNGREAYEYVKKHPVDLAIVDYYMPVMDGREFLRSCHEEHIYMDVIMITAANSSQDIAEFLRLGIIDYLVKPFTRQRFCQAIEKYLFQKKVTGIKGEMNQGEIDRLMQPKPQGQENPVLEKGLQEQTLLTIRSYLEEKKGQFMSCNEISNSVNLSRITVRRYLNYLVETREIISQIDYSTGGRPSIKYKKI